MNWEEIYKQKLVSVEEAAAVVKSGDRILTSICNSLPYEMLHALEKRIPELENVELFMGLSADTFDFFKAESKGHIHVTSWLLQSADRKYYPQGNIDTLIHNYFKADWICRNRYKPNVFISEVSLPDENGYMSIGPIGSPYATTAMETAEIVIAQVNRRAPYVHGSEKNFIHVKDCTHICEVDRKLSELEQPFPTEKDKKIASYILPHIPDGACIQIGLGGVANAVAYSLDNHKNLGIHTEMLSDSMVYLAQKGVINGSKKEIHKGKIVTAFSWGRQGVNDFIDKNPEVQQFPTSYVNDIDVIRQHSNMISINSGLCCDLIGQVGSESIGFRQFSGTGGQLDYVRATFLSEGGKSFICMNSTVTLKDGTLVSSITAGLPLGTVVTVPRTDVQYIVTEYGIADLKERTTRERVEALINIAHPNFREQLLREAKEYGIIY